MDPAPGVPGVSKDPTGSTKHAILSFGALILASNLDKNYLPWKASESFELKSDYLGCTLSLDFYF